MVQSAGQQEVQRQCECLIIPVMILLAHKLLYLILSNLGLVSMANQLGCTRVMEHIGHMPGSICICMLHKQVLQADMLSCASHS